MPRALQLGGLLLACVTAGLAADQKGAAGNAATPRPAAVRPAPPPRNGAMPKAGVPRFPQQPIGPPLSNPASPAARLYRAAPEERDRALEKLPPKLQENLRMQLSRFDAMPKEQQDVMIRRAERFAALPPERKGLFMQAMQALGKLEPERRGAVGVALRRLQPLSEDQRLKIVSNDDFKSRFSAEEQKIIADLSEVMLPPM